MPKKNPVIGKSDGNPSIFVDSSAWVALFSRRDQHHDDADRAFRVMVASRQRILTSNLILAEIHRLLLHRAGSRAAAVALEKIESSPLIRIVFAGSQDHASAKAWMARLSTHPISYADAVSFSIMETMDCRKALSYDSHFRLAGFAVFSAISR